MPGDHDENVERIANEVVDEMVKAVRRDADDTFMFYREKLLRACMLVDGKPNDKAIIEGCVELIQACGAMRVVNAALERYAQERKGAKE
jgi:hemerythrin-like domain-containing protein